MRKWLNCASLLLMVLLVAVALWFYFTTDKGVIPLHWNAVGDIDSYGKTWTVLVLAAVGVFVDLLLMLNQRIATLNVPFTVRHPEQARPYIRMLSAWLTFLVSLLLCYVVGAVAQLYPLHGALIAAVILLLLAISLYYTHRIRRMEKQLSR